MPSSVMERPAAGPSSPLHKREMTSPFTYRYGRRFLRDVSPYLLPVDLRELNRHILRTLMLMQTFGSPFCSTLKTPPKKILELACGSAIWSSKCHQYLKQQGHAHVSFTGVDIVPVAPDLTKNGVNWRFIRHDLRQPLPFEEQEFDLIFVNNEFISLGEKAHFDPIVGLARFLKAGGVVEVWKTNLQFRCLLPDPPIAAGSPDKVVQQAESTATYTADAATPFTKAQNPYLQSCNPWIEKAFRRHGSTATPCSLIDSQFATELDVFGEIGSRRVALPFGPIRWENEDLSSRLSSIKNPTKRKDAANPPIMDRKCLCLTADQAALRRTALNLILGFIEGMEPFLIKEGGKSQDEWDKWWAAMNVDLLEKDGTFNGECLEVGAWWARKK